jgi:hypothetical protein
MDRAKQLEHLERTGYHFHTGKHRLFRHQHLGKGSEQLRSECIQKQKYQQIGSGNPGRDLGQYDSCAR